MLVFDWYGWQTNFSTPFMVSSSGCPVVPSSVEDFPACQFSFPEKLLVLSARHEKQGGQLL